MFLFVIKNMLQKSLFLILFISAVNCQYGYYGNYAGQYGYYAAAFAPCMPNQRTYNPQGCVQFMKQAAADPNLFYFGTKYRRLCENADPRDANCRSALPQGAQPYTYQTLGSRMFQDNNYNANSPYLNNLQYPLTVTYTSLPG